MTGSWHCLAFFACKSGELLDLEGPECPKHCSSSIRSPRLWLMKPCLRRRLPLAFRTRARVARVLHGTQGLREIGVAHEPGAVDDQHILPPSTFWVNPPRKCQNTS